MTAVTLFGTGIMGAPMARNLARTGHRVTVWNRSFAKAAALAQDGLVAIADVAEAARGAEIAILMLTDGPACDALLFDAGVAEALAPGSAVVVMSSIPVATSRTQAARLAERGIACVDAPVSGGEKGAIEATLSIMAGGSAEAVARVQPVLEALGRVTHVGPAGSGQLAKLANQLIVGVTIGAVSEAMLLVEAGGGDAAAVHQALMGGFADSTIWRQHGARILERRFAPGGKATVQLKDMRTITAAAAGVGLDLPFAGLAEALYAAMCQGPNAELDHSALFLELAARGAGKPPA
ncbi:NAD(P)-dependent oxidoreductase [Novosphingobium sp.]|uniref:NAD(P)-dependent oxidoreductase n=1 Tax=Novosphingobium sp. TaxID=1874826 RepID=UPI003BAB306F